MNDWLILEDRQQGHTSNSLYFSSTAAGPPLKLELLLGGRYASFVLFNLHFDKFGFSNILYFPYFLVQSPSISWSLNPCYV